MTAEIVVMNKSAVALAADSKVTVGGPRLSKTYDTVNKLFTLSKYHPVGVMIYGNADFMGFPWETIIKEYRKQKNASNHDTVLEWSKDFLKFLRDFGSISKEDKKLNIIELARSILAGALDEIDDEVVASGAAIGSDDHKAIAKRLLMEKMLVLRDAEVHFSEEQGKKIISAFGDDVDRVRDHYFSEFGDEDITRLADTYVSGMIFSELSSPISSRIVFAGFGEKEYFPTTVSYTTDGYVGNTIKVFQDSHCDIDRKMSGSIRAFAQGEMVQRFMTGMDPQLADVLFNGFHDLLESSSHAVLEKFGAKKNITEKNKKDISEATLKALEAFDLRYRSVTDRYFVKPIVQMVSLLPKDELANLAESLVALTSVKRRVSSEAETVGGAIDVAVISKGDGFVWVKRKHYFSPDINPHFKTRYFD